MKTICSNCKYWGSEHTAYGTAGACHRHAPIGEADDQTTQRPKWANAHWPRTDSEDFCGDFENKQTTEEPQ